MISIHTLDTVLNNKVVICNRITEINWAMWLRLCRLACLQLVLFRREISLHTYGSKAHGNLSLKFHAKCKCEGVYTIRRMFVVGRFNL